MPNSSRKVITVLIAVCTFLLTVFVTFTFSTYLVSGQASGLKDAEETATEKANLSLDRLEDIYTILLDEYYEDVDPNELILGAINGMVSTLDDPYTEYSTPRQMSDTETSRNGNYVGIGVSVMSFDDGYIYINRVFRDTPALEAGLRKGDIIASADGKELNITEEFTLSDAVSYIKGEEGTFVKLGILRGDERFEADVERKSVIENRVDRLMLDNGIAYLRLYDFFGNAVNAVDEAIAYFRENGAQAIIFDLRDNGGGDLDIAIALADRFMPEGIVTYTENRKGERLYYRSDADSVGLPLAVIINEYSASASEVFAGAVQDSNTGVLVGTKSYGMGIVQTEYHFADDGAGFKLTTSTYYTPGGRCIHGTGLTPDIEAEASEITQETLTTDASPETDSQLKAAYEYLLEQIANTKTP